MVPAFFLSFYFMTRSHWVVRLTQAHSVVQGCLELLTLLSQSLLELGLEAFARAWHCILLLGVRSSALSLGNTKSKKTLSWALQSRCRVRTSISRQGLHGPYPFSSGKGTHFWAQSTQTAAAKMSRDQCGQILPLAQRENTGLGFSCPEEPFLSCCLITHVFQFCPFTIWLLPSTLEQFVQINQNILKL